MRSAGPWILVFDVTSVLVFVAAGRRTHESGTSPGDIIETAAPFLIGLAFGWLISRAWLRPIALRTGYVVFLSTLVVGMLLRRYAFDDGTAFTFVLVATAILGAMIIGWRIAMTVARRSGDTDRGVSGG